MTAEPVSIEEIAAKVEAEQARLDAAKAEYDAAQAAAELRRQAAYQRHDRQTVAEFDREPLDRAVEQADAALRAAIDADPMWSAVLAHYQAQLVRAHAISARNSAARRLDPEAAPEFVPGPWLIKARELEELAERIVGDRAANIADARDQARFDAGERAARARPTTK